MTDDSRDPDPTIADAIDPFPDEPPAPDLPQRDETPKNDEVPE